MVHHVGFSVFSVNRCKPVKSSPRRDIPCCREIIQPACRISWYLRLTLIWHFKYFVKFWGDIPSTWGEMCFKNNLGMLKKHFRMYFPSSWGDFPSGATVFIMVIVSIGRRFGLMNLKLKTRKTSFEWPRCELFCDFCHSFLFLVTRR